MATMPAFIPNKSLSRQKDRLDRCPDLIFFAYSAAFLRDLCSKSLFCSFNKDREILTGTLPNAFFINYQKVREIDVKILGHAGPQKALEVFARSRRLRKAA
jgi:hypothetical protein